MSHIASEVSAMFQELDASAREEHWIGVIMNRNEDRNRLRQLQAETKADPVKMLHRRKANCVYVKTRLLWDRGYQEMRKAHRGRYTARKHTELVAYKAHVWHMRAMPLPGFMPGADYPVAPADPGLVARVEAALRQHAALECLRRQGANRADSFPLLERSVA